MLQSVFEKTCILGIGAYIGTCSGKDGSLALQTHLGLENGLLGGGGKSGVDGNAGGI